MANSYLNKTFSGAPTNAKKGTISMWFKLSQNDSSSNNYYRLFVTGADGSNRTDLNIVKPDADVDSNDLAGRLYFSHIVSGTAYHWRTNKQFRDFSGFYNLVVAYDTTQASASDRVKIYVNGTQETSFSASATIPQDTDLFFGNNSSAHHIGNSPHYSPRFFQGYMAHFAYVDGTALTPTSFGETDSTSGIWKFKPPTGVTWGNNGVHLKFENSGNLGLDSSGNSHNFTVNGNLKQALDTPSNVHINWNPLEVSSNSGRSFANANTSGSITSGNNGTMLGTIGVNNGKWYYEVKVTQSGAGGGSNARYGTIGFHDISKAIDTPNDGLCILSDSRIRGQGGTTGSSGSAIWGSGDIIQLALDLDGGNLYVGKNGNWYDNNGNFNQTFSNSTAIFTSITTSKYWTPLCQKNVTADNAQTFDANFGNGFFGTTAISSAGSNGNGSLFEYDVPSGYYALNTKNINTYG